MNRNNGSGRGRGGRKASVEMRKLSAAILKKFEKRLMLETIIITRNFLSIKMAFDENLTISCLKLKGRTYRNVTIETFKKGRALAATSKREFMFDAIDDVIDVIL